MTALAWVKTNKLEKNKIEKTQKKSEKKWHYHWV
jgi:hypothetical protein